MKYEIKQDLTGKVFVITGASAGIGRQTALSLAKKNAHLVLMGRNKEKHQPLLEEIKEIGNKVDFIEMDLSSLKSVENAAKLFLATGSRIDVLINNAGLGITRSVTQDGFEITFGVNHLGHFLLTNLLLDRLKESKEARIVILSSKAHYQGQPYVFPTEVKAGAGLSTIAQSYFNSKLANLMHAKKLAQLLKGTGVTVYAVHPGVIASDLWRNIWWPIRSIMKLGMISEEEGALTTLYCSTEEDIKNDSGKYYDNCAEKEPLKLVHDQKLLDELWNHSQGFVKEVLG